LAKLETADLELVVAQAEAALAMSEVQLRQTKKGASRLGQFGQAPGRRQRGEIKMARPCA